MTDLPIGGSRIPSYDVRQGPLWISLDPLATTAERCLVAQPMNKTELAAFLAPRPDIPFLIAERGFRGTFTNDLPWFYLDAEGVYRNTLTDEPWRGQNAAY